MHSIKKEDRALIFAGILALALILFSQSVLSHEDVEDSDSDLNTTIKNASLWVVFGTSIIVAGFVIASICIKRKNEALKWILILGIIVPSISATIYIAASTIYLNSVSETKGPVHWHADFEIWKCNEKIDLVNPKGMVNRVGTSVFHEHGDDRMHVEGTIYRKSSVDLHRFFNVVGGQLKRDYFAIPTDNGIVQIRNKEMCNGQEGKLQAFLYRIVNPNSYSRSGFFYEQIKLEQFENHILAPYINVPPGDCVILEFGPEKDFTDKICESYKVAIERGDIKRAD